MARFGSILMLCLFLASFVFPASAGSPQEWYVSRAGSDTLGSGTLAAPFRTIARGLSSAADGDTVIVLPGRYSGPGNIPVDFGGKAVTLRSLDPGDPATAAATTLDASGQPVIARFVRDEGPGTVLEGFTLVGGEPNREQERGVPGYFAFSPGARPTTRSLRLPPSAQAAAKTAPLPVSSAAVPYGTLAWDGLDPFHQPAATTRYHGSGDVNRDGALTQADETAAAQMAAGSRAPLPEADANQDGAVTAADVSLIHAAWNGSALPGQWDRLPTRDERSALLDRILALDPTNRHPYVLDWFACYDFAAQLYADAAFIRADLSNSVYNGGQTFFNLPMYMVNVSTEGFSHEINAVLVGDDPLNFNDWRLIEPQDDQTVIPGMWDLPIGSRIVILAYDQIMPNSAHETILVEFLNITQESWTLSSYNPNLRLQRGDPTARPADNSVDVWDPRVLPAGSGLLLYERQRDDMSRVTDLHAAPLPFSSADSGQALTLDSHYSRLLDWTRGPDGALHLLWKGEWDGNPGVFSGSLDASSLSLKDAKRVASNIPYALSGRIIARSDELLAFWLKNPLQFDSPERGVYWTRLRESVWESYENLTPALPGWGSFSWPGWVRREITGYLFDVAQLPNGEVVLMWLKTSPDDDDWQIYERRYNGGAWSEPAQAISANHVRGLDLAVDSAGTLHVLYWTGPGQDQYDQEGRGILYHRSQTNGAWSAETALDASGQACCMDMSAGPEGLYAAWETRIDGKVVPAWSRYASGAWTPAQTLPVRAGAEAWYPRVTVLPNGQPVFAWSSRSNTATTVEIARLRPPPAGPYSLYFPQLLKSSRR